MESSVALAWALDRAKRSGDAVRLVTVVEEEAGSMGAEYGREVTRGAAERMSEVARTVHAAAPDARLDIEIVHGPVAWALARAVTDGDLLVVGTPVGAVRDEAAPRVLGSRSVQIAAAARCTVAVVPPLLGDERHGVVVGVETPADVPALLDLGIREARLLGEPLLLVHCAPRDDTAADGVLAAVEHALRERSDDVEISARRLFRSPVDGLVELARHASLLVMGRSRAPELNPLGTTCHRVLSQAPAPVLIADAGRPGAGSRDAGGR